jgi:hexosaminidase
MKFTYYLFFMFCSINLIVGQNAYNLIPAPQNLVAIDGQFQFKKNTGLVTIAGDAGITSVANMLSEQIKSSTGIGFTVKNAKSAGSGIVFKQNNSLSDEAYTLNVTTKKIEIESKTGKGAFYALQTIYQLMPPEIFKKDQKIESLTVQNCKITDEPRFQYRGLMLDVGRHFYPVEAVKRYIDLMTFYKLNTFHWHLTEDQGWRIEIKKYPLLTQISSKRKETMLGKYSDNKYDGIPYDGFYTQDQIKEIVAYATSKFITIIPEIEMPGHSQAVLAAYQELGANSDKIYQVRTKWGVSEDVLFPREETFTFLENVLSEVMGLFPGKYIHIGGDECPKTQWKESKFCQNLIKQLGLKDEHELQSYFIQRIDKFVSSKGKRIIGWDEILEGGLSENATVMSWRGVKGGIEAAKQNHDVVMTPNSFYYIDYYQGDPKTEPLAIGGNLPLSKVYSFEPNLPELTEAEAKHVLGVQANLWTEYIADMNYVEYMTYPRALAMAETAWSPKGTKNYDGFKARLKGHMPIMDALKINYSKAFLGQN